MLQMAPFHTDKISVPARAYAFNRYHGLYYWDSETFLLPYYLHTYPEVAENLLSFRYRTLGGARRNARRLKSPGACFPWMTDSQDGTEQAPWSIGDYVWHQNADIAYAIDQYVQATGDKEFMRDKGLEILVESARFWMSRLEEDKAGVVHLHNTVGPDELDKHGKDNGYTSLLARRHLQLAARWLRSIQAAEPHAAKSLAEKLEIGAGEAANWTNAARRMAVPLVSGRNFPLQDEFLLAKKPIDFNGISADEAYAKRHTHRMVKQSDIVLAMYLLQDEFTVEQMREAYDFYEPMTLHYSSLSYNTHSILATKIGRDQQAYDYFCKAAGLDLDDGRGTIDDGLHAAALGGTWQTLVYGFLGMRLLPTAIVFEPRLPEIWKSVSLRIAYRGYQLNLTLTHDGHRLDVEGSEGQDQARVILNGETHLLRDELSVTSTSQGAEPSQQFAAKRAIE
jgi:alpha,alpha-trehalose phosphorylase